MDRFSDLVTTLDPVTVKFAKYQKAFSASIIDRLKVSGMREEELAEKAGIKKVHLQSILRGGGNPSLHMIVQLEIALGQELVVIQQPTLTAEDCHAPVV